MKYALCGNFCQHNFTKAIVHKLLSTDSAIVRLVSRIMLPQTILKMNEIQNNKKYKYLYMIDLDFLDQSVQFIVFYWALGHISRKRIWKSIGSSFSFPSTKLSLKYNTSSSYRHMVTEWLYSCFFKNILLQSLHEVFHLCG